MYRLSKIRIWRIGRRRGTPFLASHKRRALDPGWRPNPPGDVPRSLPNSVGRIIPQRWFREISIDTNQCRAPEAPALVLEQYRAPGTRDGARAG